MEDMMLLFPWLAGGLILVVLLALLRRPLGSLLRLLGRSVAWLAVLFGVSQVGPILGIGLGVNLVNALVLGVLGAPGFGLLLLLHWALH